MTVHPVSSPPPCPSTRTVCLAMDRLHSLAARFRETTLPATARAPQVDLDDLLTGKLEEELGTEQLKSDGKTEGIDDKPVHGFTPAKRVEYPGPRELLRIPAFEVDCPQLTQVRSC